MAKYKISGEGVVDTERGAHIPNDDANRDWQEYQVWVGEGNTADPEFTAQEIEDNEWAALRSERDILLSRTDFFMTVDFYDNVLTTPEQTDISTYRQELRDLPGNTVDPASPTWPTKPQILIDYGI